MGSKQIKVEKWCGSKQIVCQKLDGPKLYWVIKVLSQKKCMSKKMVCKRLCDHRKFWLKVILVTKNLVPKTFLVQKILGSKIRLANNGVSWHPSYQKIFELAENV